MTIKSLLAPLALVALLALPQVAGAQDLTITSTTAPASGGTAQQGATFTVKHTLYNAASTGFSTNFYSYYYYCPKTTTLLKDCTYLSRTHVTTNFLGKQSLVVTSPTLTIPTTAVYGTGYIRFSADHLGYISESNETNNIAHDQISLTTRPDLYVGSHYFPYTGSVATVGATFTGRVYITNASKTAKVTTNFNVRYAYCPAKSTTGCITLANQTITQDINSGSSTSYVYTQQLMIPQGAQNGTRYIQTSVDTANAVTESKEGNNVSYYPVTINQVPSDLRVTAMAAPYTGYTQQAGDLFTVQTKVLNGSANGFTTNWRINYYYCPTKANVGCTYISYMNVMDDFNPNQTRTYISPTLTLPTSAVYGSGYIMAWLDSTKVIPEKNTVGTGETNNYAYDAISVTMKPDLTVYGSFPYSGSTATIGSTFNGRILVYNATKTSKMVTDFYLRYYYCATTTTLLTSCTLLGEQKRTNDINAGGNSGYFQTATMTIPAGAQNGTRYIRVVVDSSNAVLEGNETNNIYNAGITVNQVPSDLQVTSATAPFTGSTNQAGSTFTVQATIKNTSTNGFTNTFYTRFYYCATGATPIASCTYLGQNYHTQGFAPNQSLTITSSSLTVPTSAVFGTGYVRVWADYNNRVVESNENNNTRDAAINVITRSDLYVGYSNFPHTGGTAGVGSLFTGRVLIYNANYTSRQTKDFEVYYYYCPTKTVPGCVQLGKQTIKTDLNAGGHTGYFITPTLKIPTGAQNGTRYVRIYVDATDKVTESKETNNNHYDSISVSQVPSDLTLTKTSVPYTGVTTKAGSTFTVQSTVKNAGANGFDTNFYLYYYYCQNSNASACTYLGNNYITDNFAGGQHFIYTSGSLSVPTAAVYGTGYIRVFVDATKKVVESNESNNNSYTAIKVGTKPDLYVGASSFPYKGSTQGPGSTFTGRYRVYNKSGTSKVIKDFVVEFYYCPTSSVTATNCTLLTSQTVTKDINSGGYAGYITSPTLTLPITVKTGTRYIRIFADSKNAVDESDETNNSYYDPITVSASQVDLSISSTTAPATGDTNGAGSQFTAKATIKCSGSALSQQFAVNYYYCTKNEASTCSQLGNLQVTYKFKAGESKEFTSPTLTLPNNAIYGTGFVRIFVDATGTVTESSESNNEAYDTISVTTQPDLSVSASKVPYTGSTAKPGDTFTAQYTIANAASTSAFEKDFTASFYFCSSTSAASCTQLTTFKLTQNLASGSNYTFTSPALTMPVGAKPGTGYVRIWIDSKNDITESNENNNNKYDAVSVTGTPDLVVSTLSVTSNNTDVEYSVTVCNTGDATKSSFDVELYFNMASPPDCNSKSDHQWTLPGLAKNGCETRVHKRTNAKPGLYMGWARVDADCNIKETDENNNNKTVGYTVSLTPDVGVADVGVDSGPDAGPEAGPEAGLTEAGVTEGGVTEGGVTEGGVTEGGVTEGGVTEGGVDEAGPKFEAGVTEGGAGEGGVTEGGVTDGLPPDKKVTDGSGGGNDGKVQFEAGASKDGGTTPPADDEGCNCQTGAGDPTSGLGLLLLLGLALVWRRRR